MKYPVFQLRDMGKVNSNHIIIIPHENQICQNLFGLSLLGIRVDFTASVRHHKPHKKFTKIRRGSSMQVHALLPDPT
jgi:hypothetical protein